MFRGDLATNIKLTDRYNNNNNNNNNNKKQVLMLSTGKRNKPTSSEDMNRLKPPLHNFDLPWLKWGNQKLLRCMNVDSNADVSVLDRNHSFDSGGGIGTNRRNSDSVKRFRSSYGCDNNRKTDSSCNFSTSEKVNIVRNHSPEYGGAGDGNGSGGCTIGARRRNTECDNDRKTESYYRFSSSESYGGGTIGRKRFRSSYDDVDRKTQSFYNLSSSEKLPASNGIGTGNLITGDGEIEATREKLMFDFKTEVVKMQETILGERLVNPPPPPSTVTVAVEAPPSDNPPAAERPWNLRTRRSPAKGVNKSGEVLEPMSSPAGKLRPANGGSDDAANGERPKFSVSLSRREVEEDFMVMAGRRLPRKPKKRPRVVQKQLDTLFPGLWLSEITADLYKVPDEAEAGKRY